MLYTKRRKIKYLEQKDRWGNFEVWGDLGAYWGEWEDQDLLKNIGWITVKRDWYNPFLISFLGQEGLIKPGGQLIANELYRRWDYLNWRNLFKKIDLYLEPIVLEIKLINEIVSGIGADLVNELYIRKDISLVGIGSLIGKIFQLNRGLLSCIGAEISNILKLEGEIPDSWRWGDWETWGDIPNNQWWFGTV